MSEESLKVGDFITRIQATQNKIQKTVNKSGIAVLSPVKQVFHFISNDLLEALQQKKSPTITTAEIKKILESEKIKHLINQTMPNSTNPIPEVLQYLLNKLESPQAETAEPEISTVHSTTYIHFLNWKKNEHGT